MEMVGIHFKRNDIEDLCAQPTSKPRPVGNGGGRPPEHDWEPVRSFAEAALVLRPNITRSALADSLVEECRSRMKTGKPPVKRTIERKLKEWDLPTTKFVPS